MSSFQQCHIKTAAGLKRIFNSKTYNRLRTGF